MRLLVPIAMMLLLLRLVLAILVSALRLTVLSGARLRSILIFCIAMIVVVVFGVVNIIGSIMGRLLLLLGLGSLILLLLMLTYC